MHFRGRCIFRNDDLLEEIASQFHRVLLLFHFYLVRNHISWLNIVTLISFITNKADFQLPADSAAPSH